MTHRVSLWVLAVCALASAPGCGTDGPKRYRLSGTVTYGGKPVPRGFITFSPDTTRGNSGPGGGAAIVDGWYETAADQGVVGGFQVVRITGTDGISVDRRGEVLKEGTALFPPYQTTIELPVANAKQDFDIPKTGR